MAKPPKKNILDNKYTIWVNLFRWILVGNNQGKTFFEISRFAFNISIFNVTADGVNIPQLRYVLLIFEAPLPKKIHEFHKKKNNVSNEICSLDWVNLITI